jgi:Fe2+ transport system protein FeoA
MEVSESHNLATASVGVPHNVTSIADSRHAARLYELGMGEGTEVTIIKSGDPAILSVGSGTFAMAKELLKLVTVSCTSKSKIQ